MIKITSVLTLGLMLAGVGKASEKGLYLGESQTPAQTIGYASGQTVAQTAAEELKDYLERIFDTPFTVREGEGADILIGLKLVPEELMKVPAEADAEWLARVVTEDGHLYLWGNDLPKSPGTAWAVESFLQVHGGVRWLWPGALGEVVPRLTALRVPAGTVLDQPAFVIRDPSFGYSSYRATTEKREQADWFRRMRFGRSLNGFKGTSGFNHYFPYYIPDSEFANHPEYFALVSPRNWIGPNKPDQPTRRLGQLCTSNPEVRRIFAEKIIAADSPEIMPISPNDGFLFCECDACKAQDTTPWESIYDSVNLSDRIFDFVRDVATRVKAGNPRSKIGIFSYSFFSDPPRDLRPLPDNVYISMTYSCGELLTEAQMEQFDARLEAFHKLGVKFVGREYWGTHYYCNLPWLHTRAIDDNVKRIYRHGAIGLYGEGGKDFANNALNYYLLSALMWDPACSREAVIDDFCQAAFGKGAETMKAYFDQLETVAQAWARTTLERQGGDLSYGRRLNGFGEMYTPKVLADARKQLRAAGREAQTPEEKERIAFFQSGLDYTAAFIKMVDAFQPAAGLGVPLVFVEPRAPEGAIDDAQITQTLKAAVAAASARERILSELQGANALDLGLLLFGNQTELRPWHRIVQDALLQAHKGAFNYLVNGAFEYRDYAWHTNATAMTFDLANNHDDIGNSMANFHAKQGCSLKTSLAAGGSAMAENQVSVRTTPDTHWVLSGWIKRQGSGQLIARIVGSSDGQVFQETLKELPNGVEDSKGWREFLFAPVTTPQGADIQFSVNLKIDNLGTDDTVVWLDDLRLRKLP